MTGASSGRRPAGPREPEPEVAKEVTIYIGGIHAAEEPTLVKTLLGSCIAACLWDPVNRVGGMNHFMLPRSAEGVRVRDATRFGVHAMDVLIGEIMKAGGDRRRLVAKIFGGAHVLDIGGGRTSVPQQNIAFIRSFLAAESFQILSEDVGGYHARQVQFFTHTGRARVKRVTGTRTETRLAARQRAADAHPPKFGDVTLFE